MRWRAILKCGSDTNFPMTLVGVHDWDNLKRNEGHTHFMIANAVFARNEGADLVVMTFVPQSQVAIPLNKDTVLCERPRDGAIPWRVAMEMSPIDRSADFGAWRLCNTFSDGPSRWVQTKGLSVCPLYCTRCIRKRAPNDDVACALQSLKQRGDEKTVEHAAQVDGLEAIVNPERTLCMWFRPHSDGSKRRHLAQVDVLFRTQWMYDEDMIEKSSVVSESDLGVVIAGGAAGEEEEAEGAGEEEGAGEAEGAGEEAGELESVEKDDDALSHSTTSSSVVFSKYVGREGGRAATHKDWDDRVDKRRAARRERRRHAGVCVASTKNSACVEQSGMAPSNTDGENR